MPYDVLARARKQMQRKLQTSRGTPMGALTVPAPCLLCLKILYRTRIVGGSATNRHKMATIASTEIDIAR